MSTQPLRFLVYGSGVIGSIFAGKLFDAGFDVTMLARGQRLKELNENGLILLNSTTGRKEFYYPKTIEKLEAEDVYDFILVTMQKTQVASVLPILKDNKSRNIVFFANNPSGYDEWMRYAGKDRILIAFPSGGGERKDGVVHYFLGTGISRIFQTTTFGELSGAFTKRLKVLITAFKEAGIPSVSNNNMDAWQKYHIAVVLPIANAIYKHGGNNYALAKSAKDIQLMIRATKEGLNALKLLGYPLTPFKLNFYQLPHFLLIPIFKALMGSKVAELAMARHANNAKEEIRLLQDEFIKLVDKSGASTPAIDLLISYSKGYTI